MKRTLDTLDLSDLDHVTGGRGGFESLGGLLGNSFGRIGSRLLGSPESDPGGAGQVTKWMESELADNPYSSHYKGDSDGGKGTDGTFDDEGY